MSFSPHFLSRRAGRACLAWLVVFALALHGLIPAGYMPDFGRARGEPLALTLCSGMDMGMMAPHDDAPPAKSRHDQTRQDHTACPFSVNAVFAFGFGDAGPGVPFYVFLFFVALAGFGFAAPRRFGNASARSPPAFS